MYPLIKADNFPGLHGESWTVWYLDKGRKCIYKAEDFSSTHSLTPLVALLCNERCHSKGPTSLMESSCWNVERSEAKWNTQPLWPSCWHPELGQWLLFGVGTGRAWPQSPHQYTSQRRGATAPGATLDLDVYSQFWPLQWYFFYSSTLPSPRPFLCTPWNALSPFTKVHINFGRPLERGHQLPGANCSKLVSHYKIAVLLAFKLIC